MEDIGKNSVTPSTIPKIKLCNIVIFVIVSYNPQKKYLDSKKGVTVAKYIIIGSGRQGIAVAYYLLRFGEAENITFVDEIFEKSAEAVTTLQKFLEHGKNISVISCLAMKDLRNDTAMLKNYDVIIAALPSEALLLFSIFAARLGVSYCDYGPNTKVIRSQLDLHERASLTGSTLIPNTGIGPGLTNIVAVGGSREFDCDSVKIFIGGVPEDQNCNPLGYKSAFANVLDGYVGKTTILENGDLKKIQLPSGLENFSIGENQEMEAFFTDVGTELAVEILKKEGKIKNFWEKTLRWPGHFKFLQQLDCVGFLQTQKIQMGKVSVAPFEVARYCFDNIPRVTEDLLAFFLLFEKEGREVARVQMVVRHNPATGLTAMQQSTSANTAIIAHLLAQKKFPSGAYLPEDIVNRTFGWRFIISELQRMELPISISE